MKKGPRQSLRILFRIFCFPEPFLLLAFFLLECFLTCRQPDNYIYWHGQPTILLVQALPEKLDLRPRDKLLDMKEVAVLFDGLPYWNIPTSDLTHTVDSTAS